MSSNACWWISLNRHSFVSESLKSCWWAFLRWSLYVSFAIRPFLLTNLHMFLGKIHMFTNMKSLLHDSQIEFHVSIDYILFFDRFFKRVKVEGRWNGSHLGTGACRLARDPRGGQAGFLVTTWSSSSMGHVAFAVHGDMGHVYIHIYIYILIYII